MQKSCSAYNTTKIFLMMRNLPAFLFLVMLVSCKDQPRYPGPLSPEESMKTFQFAEDFKAEVFAAEPLVTDPVDLQFDEDGNAYVVGMLDAYKPDSVKGKGKIVMLKDINEDGRADTAIVFADSIKEASSILPWDGGLLIAAAPNIMFYKDTDGDGRADHREIIFKGFFTGNEEAQITNLRFGIDNWIYANNTGQKGEITFTRKPEAPKLLMSGADFRFRLDRNQFELSTGPGQFGLAINDWGHRFFTTNSIHISQAVIPMRYLARNPFLPAGFTSASINISDHDPLMFQVSATPYWREERTKRRNKEYQENKLDRVEYARDHFTGASGGTFYGGDAYADEYYGNIFTGDVSGNLVHRDVLHPLDTVPYLQASRGGKEKDKEFLATTDTWFRPANCATGPDGNLYVIDMYRQHIETPISIPDDLETGMDFNAGDAYGRIYRIVPINGNKNKWQKPALGKASAAQLVELLAHKNQWWRLQAQRLLLQRKDKSVIPQVKQLVTLSNDPRTRLHALYVLEALDALDAGIIKQALKDTAAGVRENAVILAERFPECFSSVEQLVTDSSIRVAFQAALSIGEFKSPGVIPALSKVVIKYGGNPWFSTAVLSAEQASSTDMLKTLASNKFFDNPADWKKSFIGGLSETIGARNNKEQRNAFLQYITVAKLAADWQVVCIKGLVKGLKDAKETDDMTREKLNNIDKDLNGNLPAALQSIKQLYGITN
ncbi:MAG: dehydrogenase [Chitinophagaceae bacterium]|nr:dehydrogenase [Chitinophagaceae bacterium]